MSTESDPAYLPPGLVGAWGGTPRPRRGPKPAHSVQQVVQAAVVLADEEGLAAASLPNIADSLGLTTNALYRYVGSKEELLVLLADQGLGPPPDLPAGPDWTATVRAWTGAALERYRTRPWLLDLSFHHGAVTPNRLRWTEVLLAAFTSAGMSEVDALGCARLVADLARTTAERILTGTDPDSAESPEHAESVRAFVGPLLAERGFPHLSALSDAGAFPTPVAADFRLDVVLAGIASRLEPAPRRPARSNGRTDRRRPRGV
jgi:AcrR family transcriptional regulator